MEFRGLLFFCSAPINNKQLLIIISKQKRKQKQQHLPDFDKRQMCMQTIMSIIINVNLVHFIHCQRIK